MIRGVGLRSAVAVNVVSMIGAGPLVTIPLVVVALHRSVSLAAWFAGALIALCDGLVYAELASRLPRAGSTYVYVREAFGARGPGRLLAFLFVWQFCLATPLLLASGYIGFAQYAAFAFPLLATNVVAQKLVAVGVGVAVMLALFRAIPGIARTVAVLGVIALATLVTVAAAGLLHPHVALAGIVPRALSFAGIGPAAFGAALVITFYDYVGYNEICAIGDEVRTPERTMPRAVLLSVGLVFVAYVLLNLGVFAALPIAAIATSSSVASDVVERNLGHPAALAVTFAVLVTAFASTYGLLLGAARIPYAAARDGDFLPVFARLHPTKRFPSVALVTIGTLALPAALLPLDAVIATLTAAGVLVSGFAQIVALWVLRARTPAAPFRMPLYPLPSLIAFAGWIVLFAGSGRWPMAFGCATLAAGALVYLARARRGRLWPFAAALLLACACIARPAQPAAAATFTHAVVVQRDGNPTLLVDGQPFFFYGAAFFYERIPPTQWRASMLALKALGFNTLDLYVPWNWHEPNDGDFDFDGHTNPRRNLRAVLALARDLDFRLVVRPGPVIRNEWRNGGYPAWLLTRPEYGMPLHDVLEGRYPATATLQNAHSDDAAAEWMRNATHLKYATRWLTAVLHEFEPLADRVIAVQLDDDQGAYIDNQTWPAPHLQAYLQLLARTVRSVVGPQLPLFINTYEMKVTASAPVWAMGNWYQSEAYAIGEHDRASLEFSAGLLQTETHWPLAMSEFQAGWLAAPEDPAPRPADPANTTLALHTLLGAGMRGAIDFPPQDTVSPAGWEAPFANASYAWDAALRRDLTPSARYAPTAAFGALVTRYGTQLASAHRVADGAIAYLASAYDERTLTNATVFAIVARTQDAQRACRAQTLTCDLVDLRFAGDAVLRRYPFLVVPAGASGAPFTDAVQAALRRYVHAGGRIVATPPAVAHPVAGGIPGATLLRAADGTRFLDVVNYGDTVLAVAARTIDGIRVPAFSVAARDAVLHRLGAPDDVPAGSPAPVATDACIADAPASPGVRVVDIAGDGFPQAELANASVVVRVSPDAGARLVDLRPADDPCANAITSVGALRDDVEIQPPPSTTDRIGIYTRSFPAGMFNRPYVLTVLSGAAVRVAYDAPDVVPAGAHFERTIALAPDAARAVVDERVTFGGGDAAGMQRAVSLSSFDTRRATVIDERAAGAVGFFDAHARRVTVFTWRAGDVEDAQLWTERTSTVVRVRFAPGGTRRLIFAIDRADGLEDARSALRKEHAAAGTNIRP